MNGPRSFGDSIIKELQQIKKLHRAV